MHSDSTIKSINYGGRLIQLDQPLVMGIVNCTPDSFYDGGTITSKKALQRRIEKLIHEGVDILDVGGASSRPGSVQPNEDVELERILPALRIIRKLDAELPISIDTYRSNVVRRVYDEVGPVIVNDISAGIEDAAMLQVVGEFHLPYIMMHMQGNPSNMQNNPMYKDIVNDLLLFFSQRLDFAKEAGIVDVIIDPGFGFGKTVEHNFELLRRLAEFSIADLPLLVGLSRKSMIYKTLDDKPENALAGTLAAQTIALQAGAKIIRTHDVKEAKDCVAIYTKIR